MKSKKSPHSGHRIATLTRDELAILEHVLSSHHVKWTERKVKDDKDREVTVEEPVVTPKK